MFRAWLARSAISTPSLSSTRGARGSPTPQPARKRCDALSRRPCPLDGPTDRDIRLAAERPRIVALRQPRARESRRRRDGPRLAANVRSWRAWRPRRRGDMGRDRPQGGMARTASDRLTFHSCSPASRRDNCAAWPDRSAILTTSRAKGRSAHQLPRLRPCAFGVGLGRSARVPQPNVVDRLGGGRAALPVPVVRFEACWHRRRLLRRCGTPPTCASAA